MDSTEYARRLHHNTGHPINDLIRRFVHLRKAELLTKEGHGPHAADISAKDGANGLIALMAPQKATQTVEAVKKYGKLVDKNGVKFASALADILNNRELARQVEYVKVCRTFPEAVIRLPGEDKLFTLKGKEVNPYDARIDYTLSGGVLSYLAGFGFDEAISVEWSAPKWLDGFNPVKKS